MINAREYKHVHMIGIGGVGMSGLAKYLREQGITVTGQDTTTSDLTRDLQENFSVHVEYGDSVLLPEGVDTVIYSRAVPETDVQRLAATERGVTQYSYPEFLGKVVDSFYTIAIAGTNGKTTTTAMVVELLDVFKKPFNAIVGAPLQKYGTNYISHTDADTFVIEACEYKNSFYNYSFDVLVITNITEDHLDFFKDLEDIQQSFITLLDNAKEGAVLVCDTTHEALKSVIEQATKKGITVINYHPYLGSTTISVPGEHNVANAAAALAVVEYLGGDSDTSKQYLASSFRGAKRRLEYLGKTEHGSLVYDDYAHNPEGLRFLISGLRKKYPDKKIVMLFEPHLYSRTRDFKEGFARELQQVDELYLFPTYRAREVQNLQEDFLLAQYIDTDEVVLHTVESPETFVRDFDESIYNESTIIISAGAGDVWKHSYQLIKKHSI